VEGRDIYIYRGNLISCDLGDFGEIVSEFITKADVTGKEVDQRRIKSQ